MVRRLALVLAVLAVATVGISATGGFSSVSAERGVDVTVVPDEHAFLGVEIVNDDSAVDNGNVNVKITNRFDTTLDEVTVTIDGDTNTTMNVGPNKSKTFVFTDVDCDRVEVSAHSDSVSVELERDCSEL